MCSYHLRSSEVGAAVIQLLGTHSPKNLNRPRHGKTYKWEVQIQRKGIVRSLSCKRRQPNDLLLARPWFMLKQLCGRPSLDLVCEGSAGSSAYFGIRRPHVLIVQKRPRVSFVEPNYVEGEDSNIGHRVYSFSSTASIVGFPLGLSKSIYPGNNVETRPDF